ncbi:SAM-dependent methyltransferase [Phormidium sp. CCY1219]|uniref:SAM-dependent methyltransferase n=1 Tax=Phormidium sp. CCY1219 TaxID=2886104 RepID=UPI002D1EB507|nr:methyltransferase domain-containing protein [Phormidium sp. CCY1219]MEB3830715.1 methyltransferase domain-containing protein [Phormidium sp. CCY1219]
MDVEAFFTVHRDMPREGPGSDEATREAIRRLPSLPPSPRILDVGCGPGRQSLVLARELNATVTAVDIFPHFLQGLRHRASDAGMSDRIITREADMAELSDAPGSFDVIWSEGSIYIVGFATGLRLWRSLLRPGGFLVASECTWIAENPPAEALEFWQGEYPGMTTIAENLKTATETGYQVLDNFTLPRSNWWDEYYHPLRQRIAELRAAGNLNPQLSQIIAETEREIDICDRFGETFAYVFYLMQKV